MPISTCLRIWTAIWLMSENTVTILPEKGRKKFAKKKLFYCLRHNFVVFVIFFQSLFVYLLIT